MSGPGLWAGQGLDNPDRLPSPMVREGNALKPTTWDKALGLLAQKLGEVKSKGQAGNVVFINQHESGTFSGFRDQWLSANGMPNHLLIHRTPSLAPLTPNQQALGATRSAPRLGVGTLRG